MAGHKDGLTLLEVVVAFAILAISLAVIFNMFASGASGARRAEQYTVATLLAESQLTAAGIEEPLTAGSKDGDYLSEYCWRRIVRPLERENQNLAFPATLPVYEVTVTVEWSDRSGRRSVTLRGQRIGGQ